MLFRIKAWVVSRQCRRGSRPCPHHLTSTGGWVWFDGDFPRISQGSICEIEISSKQHKNVKIRPVGNCGEYTFYLKNGTDIQRSNIPPKAIKNCSWQSLWSKFCVTEVSIRTCHKWEIATRIWMNQIHIFESPHTLSSILWAHWEKLWWGLAIVIFYHKQSFPCLLVFVYLWLCI